jgi:hypothetical protein
MEPMKKRHGLIFPLILLITALACILPGQSPASVSPPTPDTRLGTIVAETVSAALELTRQAIPTETPPPTPTQEPTATPTPVADTSGSTLTRRDDGSTLFTDTRAGYEIIIPAGWLAVRVNQQEYFDAWLLPELSDPALQRAFNTVQDQDPEVIRLVAFDIREGQILNGVVTNVNLTWDRQLEISFDSEEDLQAVADDLSSAVEGLTVYASEIVIPQFGDIHGEIQSEIEGLNADGQPVTLYQKMVIFNLETGTLIVTFTSEIEVTEETLSMFEATIASLRTVEE